MPSFFCSALSSLHKDFLHPVRVHLTQAVKHMETSTPKLPSTPEALAGVYDGVSPGNSCPPHQLLWWLHWNVSPAWSKPGAAPGQLLTQPNLTFKTKLTKKNIRALGAEGDLWAPICIRACQTHSAIQAWSCLLLTGQHRVSLRDRWRTGQKPIGCLSSRIWLLRVTYIL